MPSRFADAESIVSVTNDAWYGEETRIVPMAKGQYFGASANGEFLDIVGIVDINPVTVLAQDEGAYDGMQPGLAGERMHVSYDLSNFTDLMRLPSVGSEIWMLTRETSVNLTDVRGVPLTDIIGNPILAGKYLAKWRVTRVDPDGIGRIICVCTKAV